MPTAIVNGVQVEVPVGALPNSSELDSRDSVPWYLKYGARLLATFAAILSIVLGVLALIWGVFTSFLAVLSAISEMSIGCFVILVEAPFIVPFLSFARKPGEFLDGKSPFIKVALYLTLGIIPILLYQSIYSIFGPGLVFVSGLMFALIAFGRKASGEDMQAAAGGQPQQPYPQPVRTDDGRNGFY